MCGYCLQVPSLLVANVSKRSNYGLRKAVDVGSDSMRLGLLKRISSGLAKKVKHFGMAYLIGSCFVRNCLTPFNARCIQINNKNIILF